MSKQIVILAAGKGTRMAGLSAEPIPKVLIPLGDKPVIQHLLDEVKDIVTETPPIIVVGFQAEKVKEQLGNDYLYALQVEQKGTGHAVMSARDLVTAENFVVLNGDMPFISKDSIEKMAAVHATAQAKVTLITAKLPSFDGVYDHYNSFGRIIRNNEGQILKIQEYLDSTDEQRKISEVNTGEYVFNSEWLWQHLEKIGSDNAQGEIYLTDIVELAIKDGQKVESISIPPEELFGINTPEHLAHAHTLLKK